MEDRTYCPSCGGDRDKPLLVVVWGDKDTPSRLERCADDYHGEGDK